MQDKEGVMTVMEFFRYRIFAVLKLMKYKAYYTDDLKFFVQGWDMNQMVDEINQNLLGGLNE